MTRLVPACGALIKAASGGGGDPDFASVVLLWGNETGKADADIVFDDQSPANLDPTRTGSIEWDTGVVPPGTQTAWPLFDGNGDALSHVQSASYDAVAGPLTIDGIIRPNTANFRYVLGYGNNSPDKAWVINHTGAMALQAGLSSDGVNSDLFSDTICTLTINEPMYFMIRRNGTLVDTFFGTPGGAITAGPTNTILVTDEIFVPAASMVFGGVGDLDPTDWFSGHGVLRVTRAARATPTTAPTLPFPSS